MFYYRDYTFDEAGWIFCLTAISTGKVCCIVANLSEHTYIDSFTFIILYRISLLIEKNFFKSHRNSFHVHFCHCFFILIVLMLCIHLIGDNIRNCSLTNNDNILKTIYNKFFVYIHCLLCLKVGLPGLEPGIQDYESCVINLLTIGPK